MVMSERKRALQEVVLDAAQEIVAAQGLSALKARDLARKADCSLGAIYTVFVDLDALVLAVNGRTLSQLEAQLAAYPEPASSGFAAITEWLVALSRIYLDFAAENRLSWRALFEFRMAEGKELPEAERDRHNALFAFIERPLAIVGIEPDRQARQLLARSLFSAVHGMVALGLEEKLARMPLEVLKEQVALVVKAVLRGLPAE